MRTVTYTGALSQIVTWLTWLGPAVRLFSERLSVVKLPLRLEPELFIPTRRSAVLFPDFSRAPSDPVLGGFRQNTGAPLQLFGKRGYALRRFPIAYPARETPVFSCLGQNAADELLAVHSR